jgi:hypothetical protein
MVFAYVLSHSWVIEYTYTIQQTLGIRSIWFPCKELEVEEKPRMVRIHRAQYRTSELFSPKCHLKTFLISKILKFSLSHLN